MVSDERPGAREDLREFLPVVCSNLLPLGGVILLGWEVVEVLATYWIEMAAMLVVYSAAALFAERRIVLDGRSMLLPGVSDETDLGQKWEGEPRPTHLPGPLPPVYRRNAFMVFMSLVFGAFWVGFPVFGDFPYIDLASAVSPTVLLAAFGIVVSQLAEIRREFFGKRRYEEMSVHMVLEIPIRSIVFMGTVLLILHFFGILLLLGIHETFGPSVFDTVLTGRVLAVCYALVVMVAMLAVEWSRFWAHREPDPGGLASWFTPEDPLEE
ncbi:DUF6498-containing protein [Halorussus salinus]|uniref:DUF6498-containing protein n=1 Tax=Halorussus salinus TaxID=1364935 RepID=UPI0010929B30|nr:DUF6498-containing protein [Halorussus salinus]